MANLDDLISGRPASPVMASAVKSGKLAPYWDRVTEDIKNIPLGISEMVHGTVAPVAEFGSLVPIGLEAIARYPFQGADETAKVVQRRQEQVHGLIGRDYKTGQGKLIAGTIAKPFEWWNQGSDWIGEKLLGAGFDEPTTAAIVAGLKAAPAAIPLFKKSSARAFERSISEGRPMYPHERSAFEADLKRAVKFNPKEKVNLDDVLNTKERIREENMDAYVGEGAFEPGIAEGLKANLSDLLRDIEQERQVNEPFQTEARVPVIPKPKAVNLNDLISETPALTEGKTPLALPAPEGMGEGFTMREPKPESILRKAEPDYIEGKIPENVKVEYQPIIATNGKPYVSEVAARAALRKRKIPVSEGEGTIPIKDTHEVIEVEGGFGLKRKAPLQMTSAEFSAIQEPMTSKKGAANIPPETTPKAVGGKETTEITVREREKYKSLAYNQGRESSGTDLSNAIKKNGSTIINKEIVAQGPSWGITEFKYTDANGLDKYGYSRLRQYSEDGFYEDSIVSVKRIPRQYLETFFKEAESESGAFQKQITKERKNNPDDVLYWVDKAKERANKNNEALMKEYKGDLDKAYEDKRWLSTTNLYQQAEEMLAEHKGRSHEAPYNEDPSGKIKRLKAELEAELGSEEIKQPPNQPRPQEGGRASHKEIAARSPLEILRDERGKIGKDINDPNSQGIGFEFYIDLSADVAAELRKARGIRPGLVKPAGPDRSEFEMGDVVKHRNLGNRQNPRYAPPVFEDELNIVQNLPELRTKPLEGKYENPIRTFEELGQEAKELFYRPVKEGEKAWHKQMTDLQSAIKAKKKSLPWGSAERIGAYAIAQQAKGVEMLRRAGKKVPELAPQEMAVYDWMRGELESLYDGLQDARALAGKEPFPKRENYFTFFHELSFLDEMGWNPVFAKADRIENAFIHMKATPFGFAKKRTGAIYPVQTNAFNIFEKYANSALRHINLSPAIAKGRELLLTFEDGWRLGDEKPATAKFITQWLDFVAGQKPVTNMPRIVERGLTALNKNVAFAVLSLNARSALVQPTSLWNAAVEIGIPWTLRGLMGILDISLTEGRSQVKAAMEKSNVLLGREYDAAVTEAMQGITGKLGAAKRGAAKLGLKPLQLLDMEAARATWIGAFKKALSEGRKEREAINFADDTVTRTQASAQASDMAPVQRTTHGKTLTLFQTFVINDWGFLTRDVLGIKNASITNKQALKKAFTWIVGATLINTLFEDVMGTNSPYPAPINAFRESMEQDDDILKASLNAGFEVAQLVPGLGGLRYGSSALGASADLGVELSKKLAESSGRYVGYTRSWPEIGGKLVGIPGTAQAGKLVRGIDRDDEIAEIIMGKKPEPRLRSRKLQTLGGSLKSLSELR